MGRCSTVAFGAWMVLAVLFLPAAAGADVVCSDWDADLICDFQDNCTLLPNGPDDPGFPQYDADFDGHGNLCDADYDQDGSTTVSDYALFFLPAFTGITPNPITDHDGDDLTTTTDFTIFLEYFQNPPGAPGPSGLPCAGTVPCLP